MTTIAVDKLLRNLLEEYATNDESMDLTINRLLDSYESIDNVGTYDKTNINMSDTTFKKLKSHRLYNGESNASVLARLLFAEQLRKG